MDLQTIARAAVYFIPFLFALCFHELAHGMVAKWRGDNTAQMMGRLTMNPMAHADILGTFVLPLSALLFGIPIFFGWAKPVPVNSRNLKNPRVDMFWIALAGPLSNILLAIVGAVLMRFSIEALRTTAYFSAVMNILDAFIVINLFLAVFNLIPLNPLDGGKVLARFLPAHVNHKLEQYEHISGMILMVLILAGVLRFLSVPVFYGHEWLKAMAMGI